MLKAYTKYNGEMFIYACTRTAYTARLLQPTFRTIAVVYTTPSQFKAAGHQVMKKKTLVEYYELHAWPSIYSHAYESLVEHY